ncbi:DNA translocase FtsK, partial [Klebsiella pneumoniae]
VPLVIETPVIEVPQSTRVAKERQQTLFADVGDAKLPQVDLLDAAPGRQETVTPESLEMTSRLIEKKLRDFGVEVHVVAASPGPVI